jgi:two-component system, cell cycle response regulator
MALKDRQPASEPVPSFRSGIRPAVPSAPELPRLWDDRDEDMVEVTETTRTFEAARRTPGRPRLKVMSGVSAGEVFAIDAPTLTIGRSSDAQICLQDQGVSRMHCRIVREGDEVFVEDLGSSNGTFVDGISVGRAKLAAGARLQLGPNAMLQLGFYDEAEEMLARQLFEASTRDPLTRAYNRRCFHQRLEEELSYARRHKAHLAVIVLDLDHFKAINDTDGHAAGDAVLRAVADAVFRCARREDVVTRYGGEEFAVLARVSSIADAERFAERIRTCIARLRVPCNGKTVKVTTSVGVAELGEIAETGSGDDLVALADRRLYRAKLLGRNRVVAD